ncbi:hypothetical protein ACET3Z_021260 [Daucus carota]
MPYSQEKLERPYLVHAARTKGVDMESLESVDRILNELKKHDEIDRIRFVGLVHASINEHRPQQQETMTNRKLCNAILATIKQNENDFNLQAASTRKAA